MEELAIAFLQGRATPEQVQQLDVWRRTDPDHERQFEDLVRFWDAIEAARDNSPPAPPPSGFEVIRAARQRRIESTDRLRPPTGRVWLLRVAAIIAVVAPGLGLAMLWAPRSPFAGGEIATSANEMATLTLKDGSLVRVGPGSRIRFGEAGKRREVWLEGEAFFTVAPRTDRPFVVRTSSGEAVVLGTRFAVQTSDQAMEVRVLEGRVALSSGNATRELVGGEVGQVAAGNLVIRRASEIDELRPQLGNFLSFLSTPIWSVAREVEAHYGLPVKLEDGELGGRTVTATFQDESFEEVLTVVCRVTGSPCTVHSSGAVIGARND